MFTRMKLAPLAAAIESAAAASFLSTLTPTGIASGRATSSTILLIIRLITATVTGSTSLP